MKNINISKKEFFNFVKEPHETEATLSHYLGYFDKFAATGRKANWNWGPFVYGPTWFFYRKMYLYANVLAFWWFLIAILWTYFNKHLGIDITILLVTSFHVITTVFGDYAYLIFAGKNIKRGNTTSATCSLFLVCSWILSFWLLRFLVEKIWLIPFPVQFPF